MPCFGSRERSDLGASHLRLALFSVELQFLYSIPLASLLIDAGTLTPA